MEKIKMLVVDDNVEFVDVLKKYFNEKENMCIKYVAYDGEEELDILNKN